MQVGVGDGVAEMASEPKVVTGIMNDTAVKDLVIDPLSRALLCSVTRSAGRARFLPAVVPFPLVHSQLPKRTRFRNIRSTLRENDS